MTNHAVSLAAIILALARDGLSGPAGGGPGGPDPEARRLKAGTRGGPPGGSQGTSMVACRS